MDRLLSQFRESYGLARPWDIHFDAGDIRSLCTDAAEALWSDLILMRAEVLVTVCDDIYGQFYDLLTIFQRCGDFPATNNLFLSDYIDRGYNSVDTITYLPTLTVEFSGHIWLLRGNQETPEVSKLNGFFDKCARR
jgi:serine/threonine-protein phosphatase PP1 catalytic subunit